jgi:hypothetical protein
MNRKFLIFFSMFLLAITAYARTSYHESQSSYHVSPSKLHNVFHQVKKNSDVSQKALANAFYYYEKHRHYKGLSPRYLAIADYTKLASQKRLYIINLQTAEVLSFMVAHGRNSGEAGDRVWNASNVLGSYQTPIGFFKVGYEEKVTRTKGYDYLDLDGLEWKNKNAKDRQIILHTASYVRTQGRSKGCFAIKPEDKWQVFPRLKNALLFSYVGAAS